MVRETTGNLQDLDYSYDNAGNILSIYDDVIDQTQSFTNDAFQRLTSAEATGGQNGLYSESYTYNTTGTLASKAGITYTYDANHPHTVSTFIKIIHNFFYIVVLPFNNNSSFF